MMFRKGIYVSDTDIGASLSTWLVYGALAVTFGFLMGTCHRGHSLNIPIPAEFSHD